MPGPSYEVEMADTHVKDASSPPADDTGKESTVAGVKQREDELVDDPELEMLLDSSLNEFGKHVPSPSAACPSPPKPRSQNAPTLQPRQGAEKETTSHMEEAFAEELAAQSESEITQTLQKLITDPELLQQCEMFAKSLGLQTEKGDATSRKKDDDEDEEEESATGHQSLEEALEETVKQLQQSAQQLESEGGGGGNIPDLSELLGGLPLNDEGGEGEELVKVMEGMMSSLLSRDILYPSIDDLCRQYPEWLEKNRSSISEEDYTRYSKQLDVMRSILTVFDQEDSKGAKNKEQEQKILELMQQLQEYGQPPKDLAGSALPQGMPPLPQSPDNCPVQ